MKAQRRNLNRTRQGGALLSVIIALILVSILGASMAGLLYRTGHGQAQSYDLARARYLAESGINFARSADKLTALSTNAISVTVAFDAYEQFTVTVTESNEWYRVESLGITGLGTGRETRQRITRSGIGTVFWDPDAGPPPMELNPAAAPVIETFNNASMPVWGLPSLAAFGLIDVGGNRLLTTATAASFDMWVDKLERTHYIGLATAHFDNYAALNAAWKANNMLISYEVQVKMAWDYDRLYGAQGLALGLFNTDKWQKSAKPFSYFVSLMRYANDSEAGKYNDTISFGYDAIPNQIKPPGLADHRLLVVWMQTLSGNDRQWIAYKDLDHYAGLPGEAAVDWVMDYDDGQSGMCFKDYTTIGARIMEERVGDIKYRYLQVFRADPKTGIVRAGNTVGNDINENRAAYLPQAQGGTFPQWNPLDFNDWKADQDCFTFLGTLSGNPLETVTWDGINSNDTTQVFLMPDHGTLRLASGQGTTKDATDFAGPRYEIGLNTAGNFYAALGNWMYFDDFAVRFLRTNTDGEVIPGVQY